MIPLERIENKIFLIRDKKVMLDRDLALLYGVETRILNQAVSRNRSRFPEDFTFKLTLKETRILRSQFVILEDATHDRYAARVFTEQGVAMLSSVLKSKRAVMVNIQIIRTFTKLREMIAENDYLYRKLEAMESKYDERFKEVFTAIKALVVEKEEQRPEIGFRAMKR